MTVFLVTATSCHFPVIFLYHVATKLNEKKLIDRILFFDLATFVSLDNRRNLSWETQIIINW